MGTSYEDAPNRYNYRLPQDQNVFCYYFSIFEKLIKKFDIPFKLKGNFREENQPQVVAIREALVNLLIHTDYFNNSKPRIRVFLDRIEFFNPGALPKDIEFILKEDFSLARNPVISRIFRIINLSESIGSGFHKMISGWSSHYQVEPQITGDFDYYKIVFKFKDLDEGLNEGLKSLFEVIKKNPGIQAKNLATHLERPLKTIERQIKALRDLRLIERRGSRKTGGYFIKTYES